MSYHYRVVERKNTLPNAKKATAAYAVPLQIGKMSVKELSEDIADRTTLHRADVRAVLDVLSVTTLSALQRGFGVDLGELGSFTLRLRSHATEKKADFESQNIRDAKILYSPSVEMKEKLARITFRNIEELTNGDKPAGEGTPTEPDPSTESDPTEGGATDPNTGGAGSDPIGED